MQKHKGKWNLKSQLPTAGQKSYTENAATVIFVKLLEEREPQHLHYELGSQQYLLPLTESLSWVLEDSSKYTEVTDTAAKKWMVQW